jgi:hypothetical protein
VTLTGTLSPIGTATFTGWIGGWDNQGQYHWIPVTIQLDSGAEISSVDGQLLRSAGILTDGKTVTVQGFGTSPVTAYQYPNLTLVPEADPHAPILAGQSLYSGIGQSGLGADFQVNLGQNVLRQGNFTIHGNRWSFTYQPAAMPDVSTQSAPPTAHVIHAGYLGVQVAPTPSSWSVQGCQILNVITGSPAAQAGLVGADNRIDPVGDVMTQIVNDSTRKTYPITTCQAFQQAMAHTLPGQALTISYYHRQVFIVGWWEPKQVTVFLQSFPSNTNAGVY